MNFKDVLQWGGGGLFLLLTLIQISPIKINPWSKIGSMIGRAINKDVIDKVNSLEKKIDNIEGKTYSMELKADERNAKECRTKILRFGDELLHDVSHSKEHFDEVLLDITEYQHYCELHPDFSNHITIHATKRIEDTYQKLLSTNDFLK